MGPERVRYRTWGARGPLLWKGTIVTPEAFRQAWNDAASSDHWVELQESDLPLVQAEWVVGDSFISVEGPAEWTESPATLGISRSIFEPTEAGLAVGLERYFSFEEWGGGPAVEAFLCALRLGVDTRARTHGDVRWFRPDFFRVEAMHLYHLVIHGVTLREKLDRALELDRILVREAFGRLRNGYQPSEVEREALLAPADSFLVEALLFPDSLREQNRAALASLPWSSNHQWTGLYRQGVIRVEVRPVGAGTCHVQVINLAAGRGLHQTREPVSSDLVSDVLCAMKYDPGLFEWRTEPLREEDASGD